MNYIELINNFWRLHEEDPFGTVAGMLYFHILDVSNKQNWRNPFKRQNTKICADLGITNPTLKTARNQLMQRGVIKFYSKGKGDTNVTYEIMNVKNFHSPFHSNMHSPFHSNDHLSKTETETETQKKIEEAEKRRREIDLAISEYSAMLNGGEEKEKGFAQKEKEYPALATAVAMVSIESPGMWRNVIEHHLAKGLDWGAMVEFDRAVVYQARLDLFKLFYEQKEDEYKKRFPEWTDIAKNFYYWVPKQPKENTLTKSNNANRNDKPITKIAGSTARAERNNGVEDLIARSGAFLQQHHGNEPT